jgi:leader peptidase (prepilin peptidase) / N-methyltransferase
MDSTMPYIIFLQNPTVLISLTFMVGLIVGSFLNVVIYRLPVMMKTSWRRECHEYLELPFNDAQPVFNLMFPRSQCPYCQAIIRANQNIPVISYILLKGRCANCKTPISLRYPIIELLTGICSALVAWRFGYSSALLFGLILTWSLIALSFIDIDQQLLPDSITLPVLWIGLLLSLYNIYTSAHDSIIGAIAGYLSLWSVYYVFKLTTGKEGMGFGDFKLLAMLGAWLGWQYLPLIILLSSVVGAIIGICQIAFAKRDAVKPMPFGQYLALAGWIALLFGNKLNAYYLHGSGLGI